MKRLLIAIVLCTYVLSYAQNAPKVLLFMRNAQTSGDLEYMLKKEVGVMKDTLEKSGYKVVIATLDGSSFSAGSTTVKADIKLAEAKVADYAGFILPCLAVPSYPAPPEVSPEAIALVKGRHIRRQAGRRANRVTLDSGKSGPAEGKEICLRHGREKPSILQEQPLPGPEL